jgi:hypothetical protein
MEELRDAQAYCKNNRGVTVPGRVCPPPKVFLFILIIITICASFGVRIDLTRLT